MCDSSEQSYDIVHPRLHIMEAVNLGCQSFQKRFAPLDSLIIQSLLRPAGPHIQFLCSFLPRVYHKWPGLDKCKIYQELTKWSVNCTYVVWRFSFFKLSKVSKMSDDVQSEREKERVHLFTKGSALFALCPCMTVPPICLSCWVWSENEVQGTQPLVQMFD